MNVSESREDFLAGKPGIYSGISKADYFALNKVGNIPVASNSIMSRLLNSSPAHIFNDDEDDDKTKSRHKEDRILGDAVHCSVFEPEEYEKQFVDLTDERLELLIQTTKLDRRRKAHKELWDGLVERFGVDAIMNQDMIDRKERMLAELKFNDEFQRVMENAIVEVAIVWEDPEYGFLTRGRADILSPNWQDSGQVLINDLKSTRSANPWMFSKTMYDFRYYLQAMLYRQGLEANGIPVFNFQFFAIESNRPHCVVPYYMSNQAWDQAERDNRYIRKVWAKMLEKGAFGYDSSPREIGLPGYAYYAEYPFDL